MIQCVAIIGVRLFFAIAILFFIRSIKREYTYSRNNFIANSQLELWGIVGCCFIFVMTFVPANQCHTSLAADPEPCCTPVPKLQPTDTVIPESQPTDTPTAVATIKIDASPEPEEPAITSPQKESLIPNTTTDDKNPPPKGTSISYKDMIRLTEELQHHGFTEKEIILIIQVLGGVPVDPVQPDRTPQNVPPATATATAPSEPIITITPTMEACILRINQGSNRIWIYSSPDPQSRTNFMLQAWDEVEANGHDNGEINTTRWWRFTLPKTNTYYWVRSSEVEETPLGSCLQIEKVTN